MLRILESQAPAKQTATDTISILSNRLSSATLLEDRRHAILGLRSFAKQYPASVASGALRDLIAGLRRDGEDPDTLKIALETLLMLFEPDASSPEASEDIPLWLADEFTMRDDNVTALLHLLDKSDFYLRLYALQILSHVCAARPQKIQEVGFAGVSQITSVLDDKREAVRNEALLLLVALTPTSPELQKLVAFENAFDRLFLLIDAEGGLTHGSTIVQDCLSLLSNLLKLNTSNQAYFREIGCVKSVAKLLTHVIKDEESPDGVSEWARPQRDLNLWGLLTVLQLFLVRGSQGTPLSQDAFWKSGVLQRVLQIAFHQTFGPNVRARALDTCAAVIRGNPALQAAFGDLAVPAVRHQASITNGRATPKTSSVKSGTSTPANVDMSNVIESLLELTLDSAATPYFEIRLAACNCVKAFFDGHNGIRSHVLRRAIDGHRSGDDAVPNILTVLLEPPTPRADPDPYQRWMAAVLLLHLLIDHPESKELALTVSDNDNETEGEDEYDVVTFVQSITSNVVAGVQYAHHERALIGYLMLLSIWLFEDPAAVDDLLGEGSTIQGLISAVKVSSPTMPLVAGLCTFLLTIIYEFSTKDSPIPRATLHSVLLERLTREVFVDRLAKLRESPFIRDFEVLPIMSQTGFPEVYFDQTFVNFFKDNFSRFLRAIDRDPDIEAVLNTSGVSRELLDTLRAQIEQLETELKTTQTDLASTRVETGRIKQINQSLQDSHEEEVRAIRQDSARQSSTHETTLAQLRREHATALEQTTRQSKAEKEYLEQRRNALEREVARHKENLAKQQVEAEKAANHAKSALEGSRNEAAALQGRVTAAEERALKAETALKTAQTDTEKCTAEITALQKQLGETNQELSNTKSALDNSRKEVTALQFELTAAEERASKAEASLQTAQTENQKSAAENKALQNQADEAKKQLDASRTETKAVQKELEDIKKELKSARDDANAKSSAEAESKVKGPDTSISPEDLSQLRDAAAKQKDVQTELDDLLVIFADLEAKRAADKKRLKELGEEVSEDEDEEEGEPDEEEDEDEEEEEY
ncbi:Vesicle-mediated ER to Golgi transport protein [Exophiala xenobiotica]|uniref:Vesicle-mediated ER to Golgi transport protein n=1 Tax=Lithohypha guttulata TaxID=1690604 RepID=A0ABR0JX08_9EURO|nr:Vesicle-mediated ER to Golgi transport protein [Lithohypha guttulata]KAK5310353.1 Vesicle-mediated ER to Golgi transport protein [Exophiala xenobiotica]